MEAYVAKDPEKREGRPAFNKLRDGIRELDLGGHKRQSESAKTFREGGKLGVPDHEIHHFEYPITEFADTAIDPENLYPVQKPKEGAPALYSAMEILGNQPRGVRRSVQRHLEHQSPKASHSLEDTRAALAANGQREQEAERRAAKAVQEELRKVKARRRRTGNPG